jgi:hypothetical protein
MDTSQIGQHTGHGENGVYEPTRGADSAPQSEPVLVLEPEAPEEEDEDTPAKWPQTFSTGDYEWHTPLEVVTLVKAVLGDIDVDPASCVRAQATVQARTFYTLEDDGLRQAWHGTVFCNPPYKMPDVGRFCGKLLDEIAAGHTTAAILLVNAATETDWFQAIASHADALCFPDGRISFIHATKNGQSPCQGQALLYFGPQVARFYAVFGETGLLLQIVHTSAAQLELPTTPTEVKHGAGSTEQEGSDLPASLPATASPLVLAAWRMLKQHQPCTNAQMAKLLRRKREQTYEALQTLVEQGYARTEGEQYWPVDRQAHE